MSKTSPGAHRHGSIIAEWGKQKFSLHPLRVVPRENPDLPEWLDVEVRWQRGEEKFSGTSECLTTAEAIQLWQWMQDIEREPRDAVLSFTEPSLHVVSVLASDVIVFVLDYELTTQPGNRETVALAFPRAAVQMPNR